MRAGHIMTVVDIIGVGRMAHSGGGTQKAELLVRAHYRDVSGRKDRLCQLHAGLELTTAAANDQRTHQIHKATLHALLDFIGHVFPLGIQNKIFQFISRFKMHRFSSLFGSSVISGNDR